MRKLMLAILGMVTLLIAALLFFSSNPTLFLYDLTHGAFPLNEPNATYMISKELTPAMKNSSGISYIPNYVVSYQARWFGHKIDQTFLIGQSKVDLGRYVGKSVRLKSRIDYATTKQCIRNRCHLLFGSNQKAVVINIDEIVQ